MKRNGETPQDIGLLLRMRTLWRQAEQNRALTQKTSLLAYLTDRLRSAKLYVELRRLLTYLRRVRLIAFFLRAVSLLFTLLETGALVLVATVALVILLPIALILTLALLLVALLQSARTNKRLRQELSGRTVYVTFGVIGEADAHADFAKQNVLELSARPNCACLWISPHWVRSRGFLEKGFYCTARKEAAHLYAVRRYYFFSLKRNVLKKEKTVYLF